ncbi:MAG: NHLP family bacteriocin export ABC transporter peptidase/permease/ATPase subunit [Oscillospiraceae bacterium]|nr:NHLP family bacteriocin export ABC transporter peptidase/permease/ATPase subunit [Oscillospiraceae bacterium]
MAQKAIKQPVTKGAVKVPVVMQMEALECGAASLTMILAYYEKWIPLEQVREDCGVSRDGSNARNILRAARSYGLNAKAYRYSPERLKEVGRFPMIVHWEFNHFIVLNGFKGNKVYINDPARGNIVMTFEQFDEGYTGVCLMFDPSEDFQPSGKPKSVWKFAKGRLKGASVAVAFVMVTTLIASITGIAMSGFSRVFIDRLLTGNDPDWLFPFIIGLSGLAIVQLAAEWIKSIYSLKINGKMAIVGNMSYMWKVLRLPMKFFSQRMAGDIQQRKESNASIAGSLTNTLAPLVLETAMMIFYLVVMIRYSLLLTVIGVASIIGQVFVSRIISKKRVNITRVMMRDSGKLASATVSGIEMIETIKASGAENGFFEKWSGYQASVNTQNVRFERINGYLGMIPPILTQLANSAVLILGVYLCMTGEFTVGMVMAFQGFLGSFMTPAQTLISAGQKFQELRTEMERVEDVMKYPTDVEFNDDDIDEDADYDKLSGVVELKNVTFGYSRLAPPLLENFSMKLEPGSRVAFVGASGCGKSTLAKLISGLYEPWEGEILFDGKHINEINRSVFTGSVAVVDQDITLFEDTIENNIKMWDNTIEDYEMMMAARDAQIHDDIMQREGGYRYKVIEGGRDFSGGQRQRLEIARVLAQDPTIIIMDEATSALDAKTEYEVVNAIKQRDITCIVIAHRLSTIRDCDEIIVFDHGKVVERGTHEELMSLDGAYTKLITAE